jgi:hypothetical protein
MVYFNLNLTFNESTFEYSFPQEFLDESHEIALIKLDGTLEINKKINVNYSNNKFHYLVNGVDQNNNQTKE